MKMMNLIRVTHHRHDQRLWLIPMFACHRPSDPISPMPQLESDKKEERRDATAVTTLAAARVE